MKLINNFQLQSFNTFGIAATAKSFVAVNTIDELIDVLQEHQDQKKFILGGGSNMLLTQNIDALVIHINLKGKKVIDEDDAFVWVESMAAHRRGILMSLCHIGLQVPFFRIQSVESTNVAYLVPTASHR